MTDTSKETVDPCCAKCGSPRSNHPYKHPFVGPSLTDTIDVLATKLDAAERRERALLDNSERCRLLQRQSNVSKARIKELETKLAEVTAERDDALEDTQACIRVGERNVAAANKAGHDLWIKEKARAEASEPADPLDDPRVKQALDGLGYECVGCGHLCGNPEKDLALLKKAGAISCCPERKMRALSESLAAALAALEADT